MSLTAVAARQRRAAVTVHDVDVALDLTGDGDTFRSTARIRFAATASSTFLDVAPRSLRSVVLNGRPLDLDTVFDAAQRQIRLAGLDADNEVVVDALMAYSHDGEGLHRHVDVADGRTYLYAMSFLDAAPRWFACFDQPDLKAPVTMRVRCPEQWTVSGNGIATQDAPGEWRIAPTGPLATYFTTLVAGPYHRVQDEHDGIPLVLLARRSLAQHLEHDAAELFDITRRSFDELHRLFGRRYPWGEYHQAFVPDFNAGAMENPGCVTLRDALVFRSRVSDADRLERQLVMAHEMAHMWFGDLVTMRWWDDLWLNESFAEYLGQRVTGEHAWVSFGAARKSWGFAADRRPSTHPVAGNEAADAEAALAAFDGISYAKGASVLRQLALHLGDDRFLAGLRDYVATHAFGNAEFADLLAAWNRSGATNLESWAASWLRTTGLDELSAAGNAVVRRSPGGTPRVHAVHLARLADDGREQALTGLTVEADETPVDLPGDGLLLPDARDESWARIVLPASAWGGMPRRLAGVADARARVALWNALRLAVADAEVDPRLAVDIVVAALTPHEDEAVLDAVADWAVGPLIGAYLDGAAAGDLGPRLAERLLELAGAVAPGSSHQLVAARAAVAATTDPTGLAGWLDGGAPAGLVVDTELRWTVVTRLAALGHLDDDGIAAELARDHSSPGVVHAARCRAARPDPETKRRAWAALTTDPALGNYELYATAEGFWQPHQRALTAPYVAAYFRDLPAASALRAGWVADRVALRAFPWTAVHPATVAAAEELLGGAGLPAGVRRSVVDATDDLRRALAARQRFGLAPDPA